jgi:hypothetical protein
MNIEQHRKQHQIYLQTTGLVSKTLLKTKEVEKVYGVAEKEIRLLVKKRVLNPIKRSKGNWWFFRKEDIDSILPLLNSTEEQRLKHAINLLTRQVRIFNRSGWS